MKYNLHTHTVRCNHAEDTEREYIENAIANGIRVLGFSDHSPYFFDGDYYSGYRMRREQTAEYFDTLLKLKEEYKGRIDLHIGFEAEYYPKHFSSFMDFLRDYPVEYLILGQHFLKNEQDCPIPCTRPTQDEERLNEYVSQVCEAMRTGAFTCVAHPDVINYTREDAASEKAFRTICECAKETGTLLEINLLGIRTQRKYPRNDFWRIAGEVGSKVILGSDAHTAKDVGDCASYETAMNMVSKFALQYVEMPELIHPFGGKI